MGFFEKDNNNLAGNSLILDDLIITWDDDEEIQLGTEVPDTDETVINGLKSAESEQITGKEAGHRPLR